MATCSFIKESKQTAGAMKGVMRYVSQGKKTLDKDGTRYLTGVNCVADIAYQCFMATKNLYGKAHNTFFYQYVQSFSPQERITPAEAHRIALELAENNLAAFRRKLTPEDRIDLTQGNAVDLSRYADASFDAVLVFGPLYHLHSVEDQQRCIAEAKRVCKKDGKLFFAFISNDMVILTEFDYRPDYFLAGDYDKETFKLTDFPFVFHTVSACRDMLRKGGVHIVHEVASDGASELMAEKINALDAESYAQYLRYHAYICEKPEMLGMTNHLLFVGEK